MRIPGFMAGDVTKLNEIGTSIAGRAVTKTLYVSPDGGNTDGSTWSAAYTTLQAALDAASSDANDLTMIMLAPATYDINTTGDPTWSKNVCIKGSHRNWVEIKNDHASATSIIKLTGLACINDVTVDCGSGTNNGIIISGTGANGARLSNLHLHCENVTGAHTAITLSGGIKDVILRDLLIHGESTNTTGLLLNNATLNRVRLMECFDCLTGLQITNTASDNNVFNDITFHDSTLGIDIDAGNNQTFDHVNFYGCTTNVDDEVGDSHWLEIHGSFDMNMYPDNLTGVTATTGAANTYGNDTEIIAAGAIDRPFRVVGYAFEPATSEWYTVRFSDDSGSTFFDTVQFDANRIEGDSAPAGTEHIFNKGTRISASARDVSGGDNVVVWVKIEYI